MTCNVSSGTLNATIPYLKPNFSCDSQLYKRHFLSVCPSHFLSPYLCSLSFNFFEILTKHYPQGRKPCSGVSRSHGSPEEFQFPDEIWRMAAAIFMKPWKWIDVTSRKIPIVLGSKGQGHRDFAAIKCFSFLLVAFLLVAVSWFPATESGACNWLITGKRQLLLCNYCKTF